MRPRSFVLTALIVGAPALVACGKSGPTTPQAAPAAASVSAPSATPPAHVTLKLLRTLTGTQADGGVFTGQMAFDPVTRLLFVAEQHETSDVNQLFRTRVIDTTTWKVIRHIPGMVRAEDPTKGILYVDANHNGTYSLDAYDVHSWQRIASIREDASGLDPALDLIGEKLYVLQADHIDVYAVSGFRLVKQIAEAAASVSFDPVARVLYVNSGDQILVLDPGDGKVLRSIKSDHDVGWLVSGARSFITSGGFYMSSDLTLRSEEGLTAWNIHEAHAFAVPSIDASHGLLFDALNDLTNSEFQAKPDPPDFLEARSLRDGSVLGRLHVPDGPIVTVTVPSERIVFVSTIESHVLMMRY